MLEIFLPIRIVVKVKLENIFKGLSPAQYTEYWICDNRSAVTIIMVIGPSVIFPPL